VRRSAWQPNTGTEVPAVTPVPRTFGSSGKSDVSIVIVTHNSQSVIERCLTALAGNLGRLSAEVIVVDNASTDETSRILANYPGVIVVENEANVGFAGACNLGIRMSTGRQVLLLNPDAFVTTGALERLVDGLNLFPDVGLAGPTFRSAQGSMRPALERPPSIGGMFFRLTPLRYLRQLRRQPPWRPRPDTPVVTGYLIGAGLLIRRKVLEDIGGFDEGYFLYWEDMEYARRALAHGWKLLWVSDAIIRHERGGSSANVASGERHWLSLVGARRYFEAAWRPTWFPLVWAIFKVLHIANLLLVCCEGALKALIHGLRGRRARVERHRQRRREAWAFLRRRLWEFVQL
jgi:N-acetylglucosaminyl-diphospho-decaprenol L-rhamnosyltransferase